MNAFENFLRERVGSENTITSYKGTIYQYQIWYQETFGTPFEKLYRENILEYLSYLRNIRQLTFETINTKVAALIQYNRFLYDTTGQEIVIGSDDYLRVQPSYANPCTITEKDVDEFRQRILISQGKRDYALVTVLAYTGLRISEVVSILLTSICLESKELVVVGKGDKQRIVYLNDKVVHAVREYLKSRKSDSPYLFVSRQRDRISRYRVNQIFRQYSDEITPHILRHFFCTNALEKGYSYHEVANQAGHANIQTTLRYTNPTAKKMKEKANKL